MINQNLIMNIYSNETIIYRVQELDISYVLYFTKYICIGVMLSIMQTLYMYYYYTISHEKQFLLLIIL